MKLLTQVPLQPEHCHGAKANQPDAPNSLGFNEVPPITCHTSALTLPQGQYHPAGQETAAGIVVIQTAFSKPKTLPCCQKVVTNYSPAPHLRDASLQEKMHPGDPTQGQGL